MLFDTCVLLYMTEDVPLAKPAIAAIDEAAGLGESCSVSPITAWEIGLLSERGRLPMTVTPLRFFQQFVGLGKMRIEELTPDILVESSFLPTPVHRDPADRIIIATARALDLTIVTRDRLILDYAAQGHVRALAC
ncbi:MAG TPA: type II toxin-antitoxin system VapC family toxin [Devosia sp.]|uniref:type II toxin-antitoxin system VapC family toxin n=1 Tax=Devosia sp. TaxID=1871048 RepID=UPI002DDCBB9E|nr:type II toxin-antitoxin system VapC family toxin [Devosia sp.]HEV2516386.1 type II toxin-antitoxin system VapC family toxin [Devosia sp.]